jgi:ComF family protein
LIFQSWRFVFPILRPSEISSFLSASIRSARQVPDSLFALFFPVLCRLCQQPIESFTSAPVCQDCLQSVRPYAGLECEKCGQFLNGPAVLHGTAWCGLCRRGAFVFEKARSLGWYEGRLRDLIHLLKYDGFRPLSKPLGRILAGKLRGLESESFDLILPVPLHSNRQRRRGFNQSALLAGELSKICGIRAGSKDCVRVRDTPPQTGLRAAQRRKNVEGAFHVPRPLGVQQRRVLLVDDVLTTGATANSCARALLDAGAQGVWVVTLARVHPRNVGVL